MGTLFLGKPFGEHKWDQLGLKIVMWSGTFGNNVQNSRGPPKGYKFLRRG
jgi:hypothetical protein